MLSLKEIHTCVQSSGFFIQLTEVHLELNQISTVELFCENGKQLLAVNHFRKKASL